MEDGCGDNGNEYSASLEGTFSDLEIHGKIHSACSKNGKKNIILFDEKNTYILKLNPSSTKVIENTNLKYVANNEKLDFYYAVKDGDKMDDV